MNALDHDDISSNNSNNPSLDELLAQNNDRRTFLKASAGLSAVTFLGLGAFQKGAIAQTDNGNLIKAKVARPKPTLGFKPVPASTGDKIIVPEGYQHAIIARWGDPLFPDSPKWKGDASEGSAAQLKQVGDNNDGMRFFPLNNKGDEGLFVCNHEYINVEFFYPKDVEVAGKNWNLDWVKKGQASHGVSVMHIRFNGKTWETILDSKYNRNINALETVMEAVGPAAGHPLMQTKADPTGRKIIGTFGNCGNGYTPWNTYLTCEENVTDYFGTDKEGFEPTELMKRYAVSGKASVGGYGWETEDKRFDVANEPNEWHRYGWVVEIDPFDPTSTPRKLTGLGHFKHENAAISISDDKHVVVYMGDDQKSEYIYKFVSKNTYDPKNPRANRDLLVDGTLYVSQFLPGKEKGDLKGNGKWLPLTLDSVAKDGKKLSEHFKDLGELLVKTRYAADLVGATPMDRCEWVAVHPLTREVFATLTNNNDRGTGKERPGMGGTKHPDADDANPRVKNPYGQIIRWKESDPTATEFDWEIFVLAGNPTEFNKGNLMAGTPNVNADNLFNSPDGMGFDADGRLWFDTDGEFSNEGEFAGMGNNQTLVAVPGDKPGEGEIRRFMVGPSGCEVTGITFSPDYRFVFLNIQHPGEYGHHPRAPKVSPKEDPLAFSKWPMGDNEDPHNSGGRPRSATVVVWREDGGVVGA